MKKIISLFLVLSLFVLLGACSENSKSSEDNNKESNVTVDPGLIFVDITLPASFFEDQDMTTFDTVSYAEENGFKKAVVNNDGSVTVTMTKKRHNEVLTDMSTQIEKSFSDLIGASDTPYIKNISSSDDYLEVTVDVDKPGYESAFDLTPLMIGFSAMSYQMFAGLDYHCEIIIRDVSNQEIIDSVVYPDDME